MLAISRLAACALDVAFVVDPEPVEGVVVGVIVCANADNGVPKSAKQKIKAKMHFFIIYPKLVYQIAKVPRGGVEPPRSVISKGF